MNKIFLIFILGTAVVNATVVDWGPFYRKVVSEKSETKFALGPFFESRNYYYSDDNLKAYRPFLSKFDSVAERGKNFDVLWPLGERRLTTNQTRSRAILLGKTERFDNLSNKQTYQSYWLAPLWWYKRENGEENSWFLFPLYADINNGFTYKELDWVLFPLYLHERKQTYCTKSYVWPIYSQTYGDNVRRYRVWPFYCYARKDNVYEQKSILWPFWHERYSLNSNHDSYGWMFWPFYGKGNFYDKVSKRQESQKSVLWPIYSKYETKYANKEGKDLFRESVWPFYTDRVNEITNGSVRRDYWPFYGHERYGNFASTFYLWPLGKKWESATDTEKCKSSFFMPFYYSYSKDLGDKQVESKYRIWPFYRTSGKNGEVRRAFPALIPWHFDELERNYEPLWTLYSSLEKDNGEFSREILWGMYFSHSNENLDHVSLFPIFEYDADKKEQSKSISILKGLFGFRKTLNGNKYRLLWLPEFSL